MSDSIDDIMQSLRPGDYNAILLDVNRQETPYPLVRWYYQIEGKNYIRRYPKGALKEVLVDHLRKLGYTYEDLLHPSACLDNLKEVCPWYLRVRVTESGWINPIETIEVEEPFEESEIDRDDGYVWRPMREHQYGEDFVRAKGRESIVRHVDKEGKLTNEYGVLPSRGEPAMFHLTLEQAEAEIARRRELWREKKNKR